MVNLVVNRIVKEAMKPIQDSQKQLPYDVRDIENVFSQTLARESGIRMLMLSTADGLAIAEISNIKNDKRRVAAMTNSFLTLGETVTRELNLNQAEYTTVSAQNGQIVLVRIKAKKPLTLTAAANVDLNIASLLFHTRECAKKILKIVDK